MTLSSKASNLNTNLSIIPSNSLVATESLSVLAPSLK